MATGGGRCGGLSVGGRLRGSSRSKSPDMGSSGDLSSRVYFGGGSVKKTKERPCNEILSLKTTTTTTTTTTDGTRDVCLQKVKVVIRV